MSETPLGADAPHDDLDPAQAALAGALLEVLRHLEQPALERVHWFALLRSAQLLAEQPDLAALLGDDVALSLAQDSRHLTPVELDDVPADSDPLSSLSALAWPEGITGLAVCFDLSAAQREERTPEETLLAGAGSMRAAVAALEDGTVFCALRREGHKEVTLGAQLLPDVVAAIREAVTGEE